jgi:hypothetical protein
MAFITLRPKIHVVWWCGRIPTFRSTMLPPSSGWSVSTMQLGQLIHLPLVALCLIFITLRWPASVSDSNEQLPKSRDSWVGIALAYGLDDGVLEFDSGRGLGIFLFTTASRPALGPTQSPIQWVPGALSLVIKRLPRREADNSPPSSAEVKEWVGLYLHFPNTPSWRCAQLKKAQGQLYLYLHLHLHLMSHTVSKIPRRFNTTLSLGKVLRILPSDSGQCPKRSRYLPYLRLGQVQTAAPPPRVCWTKKHNP